jgi:poly-beta-1,6-N-acetyl-D-glucosamine synthase
MMHALFWLAVAWLGYVYLGYPMLLALLGMVYRVRPLICEDYLPTVSVLIAARNEEKDIAWKIRECLDWDYPSDHIEVLVASDASEDRTDEIVREITDPRLTFIRIESRVGKNLALNRLAPLAHGEIIFFTDANAHIERSALRRLVRHFADLRVGCVTGQTRPFVQENWTSGASIYWDYEAIVKRLENKIGSVLVCEGAVFCIRRTLFTRLSAELANDLELPLRIAKLDLWVRYDPGAFASEYETSSPREEFARRRRICSQGMLATQRLRHSFSTLRAWQFASRKFLRWFTLVPLALLFGSCATISYYSSHPFFRVALALQLLAYGLAGFGWLLTTFDKQIRGVITVPYYALLVCAAGLIGTIEAGLGRRFAVWEIPGTSRRGEAAVKLGKAHLSRHPRKECSPP